MKFEEFIVATRMKEWIEKLVVLIFAYKMKNRKEPSMHVLI